MPASGDSDGNSSSLGHVPGEKWAFDESVTRVFGDMLKRSIPQYNVMRNAVFDLGEPLVQPGTHIVDLGCSRGDALVPFVRRFSDRCHYLGLEVSPPMIAAAEERFALEIASGRVTIENRDLLGPYPNIEASLTLSILTLQFTPVDQRLRILKDACRRTRSGGGLILVEKLKGSSEQIDKMMVDLYHELKRKYGYSREEVERKQLALEGVLMPISAGQNEQLLRDAGFTQVDCFWRWMNFAGWVAIR